MRVWDLTSGQEAQRFAGHGGGVRAVAASPECSQALSAGDIGTVRLWDLASGREVWAAEESVRAPAQYHRADATKRFVGHRGVIGSLAALPECGQALSAGADGTLRLWNLEDGQKVRRFDGHGGWVHATAALAERGQALSAGADGTVRLWDLASGQEVQRFAGHRGAVKAVAALPEHGQALSAGGDGTARLWDLGSGAQLAVFTGDAHFFCGAITPEARFAVVGDGAGQIHVLEILL